MTSLRFRFAGFPVEVLPNALLLAGVFFLLGLSWQWSLGLIAATVAIALFSVLFHELGHATLARAFGLEPIHITLHGMGGVTRHARAGAPSRDLLIILAGPGFGFLLALIGAVALMLPLPMFVGDALRQLVFLNVLWSVFNLLPIFPLDGGQALSAFLQLFLAPGLAWPITWGLGLVLAIGLAVLSLVAQELFILFFSGMFAWQNFEMLRAWRAQTRDS